MSLEPPRGVYETVLYAEDLDAVTSFYREVLGMRLVDGVDGVMSAFRVSGDSMLLIFNRLHSSLPGRPAPSHGAAGPGHVAFRVEGSALPGWNARLNDLGIAVEQERATDGSGQLYFRDPAGNSIELVAGELWPA